MKILPVDWSSVDILTVSSSLVANVARNDGGNITEGKHKL